MSRKDQPLLKPWMIVVVVLVILALVVSRILS